MTLPENFNSMLAQAYQNKTAVGSFNVYNYETIKGVFEAGRDAGNMPVIIAFGAKYLANMNLEDVHALVQTLGARYNFPVCLHLDHCKDMEVIWQAIRSGFNSVMYDGSALPFEENLANTKLVCDIAHSCGVAVEAELGSLAAGARSHEGAAEDRQIYTDPKAAKEFVSRTGVDALAVSIGTVHGLYKGIPNIRVDILKEINETLGIPLVLHGGSGTPENIVRECIQNGIAKINVNTEISVYTVDKTIDLLDGKPQQHLSVLAHSQQKFVAEVVRKHIYLFTGR